VWADKYGYGLSKTFIGVAVLCVSLVLYVYRRVVQDRLPLHLREETPTMPPERQPVAAAAVPS
jgi:hypothetical protein